jgi:hypothetical protein
MRVSGGGLLDKGFETSDWFENFVSKGVTALQVEGVIIAQPCGAICVLPGEGFEREINCREGSGNHDWRASLRVSEDEELSRGHKEANFIGFAAVIDAGENGNALCLEYGFEAVEGFGDRVRAAVREDAIR